MFVYLATVSLPIMSCLAGFSLGSAQGNIVHLRHGWTPIAGAALFPTLLVISVTYLLVAWGINQWLPMVGFEVVGVYSIGSIALNVIGIRRAKLVLGGVNDRRFGGGA